MTTKLHWLKQIIYTKTMTYNSFIPIQTSELQNSTTKLIQLNFAQFMLQKANNENENVLYKNSKYTYTYFQSFARCYLSM